MQHRARAAVGHPHLHADFTPFVHTHNRTKFYTLHLKRIGQEERAG